MRQHLAGALEQQCRGGVGFHKLAAVLDAQAFQTRRIGTGKEAHILKPLAKVVALHENTMRACIAAWE